MLGEQAAVDRGGLGLHHDGVRADERRRAARNAGMGDGGAIALETRERVCEAGRRIGLRALDEVVQDDEAR